MNTPKYSEAAFQLNKLFFRYTDVFSSHQWTSEHDRWLELVFCLASRKSTKAESFIRQVIQGLDSLNLLAITALAMMAPSVSELDLQSEHATRITDYVIEEGCSKKEAEDMLLAIYEAAKNIQDSFGGKLQKYLRMYGERMMAELSEYFSFSSMSENDARYAFTYWLQNVMNMPLSLEDKKIQDFCDEHDIQQKEFLETADTLDINVALVDDVVALSLAEASEKSTV